MRKEKQRIKSVSFIPAVIALFAAATALVNAARLDIGALLSLGERTAMISAAINMPDAGIELVRERFRAQLADEPHEQGTPVPEQPQVGEHFIVRQTEPEAKPHETPESDGRSESLPEDTKPNAVRPPRIPAKYAAELISENFAGRPGGSLIERGNVFIKNETKKTDDEIQGMLDEGFAKTFLPGLEPQVLIFHTHATEAFEKYDNDVYDTRNTWRSTDNNNNVAAVGAAMQEVLEENGIGVIHDTTQHDYPSYNGSYERSAKTVKEYLEEYPTIKLVLDIHRDAMERENQAIVKPVTTIDGKKAAQIMIIAGSDDGTMNMPNWPENLRFAAAFQEIMAREYEDLTRPIYLCYRKYNMDLSDGSLLLEFGSNANTLEEAVYSAQLAGNALAVLIKENTFDE